MSKYAINNKSRRSNWTHDTCDDRRAVTKKAEKSAKLNVWDKVPLFLEIPELPYEYNV